MRPIEEAIEYVFGGDSNGDGHNARKKEAAEAASDKTGQVRTEDGQRRRRQRAMVRRDEVE